MTTHALHQVDAIVALGGVIGWTIVMVGLSNSTDRRARWARVAFFAPFHRAYELLPTAWGPAHALLVVTLALWLASMLVPWAKLRTTLSLVAGASLAFLAAAAAHLA